MASATARQTAGLQEQESESWVGGGSSEAEDVAGPSP